MAAAFDLMREDLDVQLARGAEVVAQASARGWRRDPIVKVSVCAEEHRVLTSVNSAKPGRWQNSTNPILVEPMDALGEGDPCIYVTVMKPTQSGGTEIGINWTLHRIIHKPSPMMYTMDTLQNAKKFSRQRLTPTIEASPEAKQRVRPARERDSGNTTLAKEYPGGIIVLAGSNSASSLRSMPVEDLAMDELDMYPDDLDGQGSAEGLAEARTSTFRRRKIYRVSSPTVKDASKIAAAFEAGDQRRYFVRCPKCDYAQTFKDVQLMDDARYLCENGECGQLIAEHEKTAMIAGGRWIPKYPERSGHHKSYTWNALYSPVGLGYSWKEIVAKRAIAKINPLAMKIYINTILAETYEDAATRLERSDLADRAEPFVMRSVPRGCLLLTAAVDVQHNRFACLLVGWGRGPQGWILDYVEIPGDPTREEDWLAVDQWIDEQCVLVNAFGVSMRPLATAVDSSAFTQDVYDYVRRRQHKGMFAVKGSSWGNRAVIGRPTLQDVNHRGRSVKQGVQLWPVGTDTAKANLTSWLVQDGNAPGRDDPAARRIHFPSDLPADTAGIDCFAMLASEKFDSTYKRGGQVVGRWVKRPGVRNEALDCLVYAWAAAHHPKVRLHTMREADWTNLEAALQPEGDLFHCADKTNSLVKDTKPIVSRETPAPEPPSGGFGSKDWNERGYK